jgi:geranylgeranyl diphosphate synthase, type I
MAMRLPVSIPAERGSTQTDNAATLLADAREQVASAVRAEVARLHPDIARITGYHFGWCDADGLPQDGAGGKGVRAALVLQSAEASGADPGCALPGAVAVELVHAFSLLHDDIMDDDDRRHHRPSAWSVFGIGPALLTGDALLNLAHGVLAATGRADVHRLLTEGLDAVLGGQAEDLRMESRPEVTFEGYLAMVAGKTAALMACACALGALLADATPGTQQHLYQAGRHTGIAFQAVDDIMGIWGDPAVTGKPVHGDLRRGKNSLPVVFARTAGHPAAAEATALLATRPDDPAELARAARLLTACGARRHTRSLADRHTRLALYHVEQAHLSVRGADHLRILILALARRNA